MYVDTKTRGFFKLTTYVPLDIFIIRSGREYIKILSIDSGLQRFNLTGIFGVLF
jgi:hypothetical protein